MIEALREIFETMGMYMPHGHCFMWEPWIFWSYVISDSLTTIAYLSDFIALVYFYHKRHDIQKSWIIPAFGLFILSCGIVHGLLVVSVFNGIYPAVAVAKVIMACISVPVAIAVWPIIFSLIKFPALEAYKLLESTVNNLEKDKKKLEDTISELRGKLDRFKGDT